MAVWSRKRVKERVCKRERESERDRKREGGGEEEK